METITVPTYEQAKLNLELLTKEYYQIESEMNKEIREREEAIRKEIKEKYSEQLKESSRRKWAAKEQFDIAEKNRATNLWFPPGTIVYEWRTISFSQERIERTGRKGVVAIFDKDSHYPENIARYSIPGIGSIVVYLLKKDGTAGKQFEQISRYGELTHKAKMWLPESEK